MKRDTSLLRPTKMDCKTHFKKVFILATLRLRWRLSRYGFKVHCGTALEDTFSTWWQIRPPKHNALLQPSRPGLPANLKVANREIYR